MQTGTPSGSRSTHCHGAAVFGHGMAQTICTRPEKQVSNLHEASAFRIHSTVHTPPTHNTQRVTRRQSPEPLSAQPLTPAREVGIWTLGGHELGQWPREHTKN